MHHFNTKFLTFLNEFFNNYSPVEYQNGEEKILNPTEIKILLLLRQNKGITSYDRIAQVLWQNEWQDKFSLEAIYKHISRIKEKISYLGQNLNSIISIPKQGYIYQK